MFPWNLSLQEHGLNRGRRNPSAFSASVRPLCTTRIPRSIHVGNAARWRRRLSESVTVIMADGWGLSGPRLAHCQSDPSWAWRVSCELGWNWKDALIYLMAIAEANHMHFMAKNNCVWGIESVCALWPRSAAMFDYPSGCVRMWLNATVTSKCNITDFSPSSFFFSLTDNPVRLWRVECLKAAASISQCPCEAGLPVFSPSRTRLVTAFRAAWRLLNTKHKNINLLFPVAWIHRLRSEWTTTSASRM